MRILYPSDPLNAKAPDEDYREEYEAVSTVGIACSLFSLEDFQSGTFRPRPALDEGETVLYRGWMLTPDGYRALSQSVAARGANTWTSPEAYERCHYLPRWYELCKEFTPETIFLARDADFSRELSGLNWPGYFVKDYVKSLTTARGSIARNPDEVSEIVALIERYRGQVEGGVCVRRLEALRPETEERFFVLAGEPHSRDGLVPGLVGAIAQVIDSPFYSVDVCASASGGLRLIELGDGQVSDRKQWSAERFAELLAEANNSFKPTPLRGAAELQR
jgi:hypothetical protein